MSALIFFPMSLCDYTFYICGITVFFLFPTFVHLLLSSPRDFILLLFGLSLNHHHLLLPLYSVAVRIFSGKGKSAKCLFPDAIALIGGPVLCLGKRYITKGAVCASPSGLHWGRKKRHKLRIQNLSDFLWGKADMTVGPDCVLNEQVHESSRKKKALFYLYSVFPLCFLPPVLMQFWVGVLSLWVHQCGVGGALRVPLCHSQAPKGWKRTRVRRCCLCLMPLPQRAPEHPEAEEAGLGGLRLEEKGKRDTRTGKGVVVLPCHAVSAGITHRDAQRGDVFLLGIAGWRQVMEFIGTISGALLCRLML